MVTRDKDGLDPRKFDNDMLPSSPEPTDEQTFENLYRCGLAPNEDSESWPAWQQWLAVNHSDAGQVQKGKGFGKMLQDGQEDAS